MIEKVVEVITQFNMLKNGDSIVIGLSGGADSICLAHLLLRLRKQYNLKLTAVHINHNLRGESALRDQKFVENFCQRENLPLKVISLDIAEIAKNSSVTLEEAGRLERYKAFKSLDPDKIAVAHNQNDNAETMLMNLCRGSGLKGMGGILPIRGNIIRPLIFSEREEIEQYCKQNGLEYCTDETNLTTDYTRNKIRHIILPALKEINPAVISGLSKNAALFRQENDFIENQAEVAYKSCIKCENEFYVERLASLNDTLLYRTLRIACENAVGLKDISFEHIRLITDLFDKASGKKINLPKGLEVIKQYDSIVFCKKTAAFDIEIFMDKPVLIADKFYMLSENSELNYKKNCIYCEDITKPFHLRTRRNGDLYINSNSGRKSIKLKEAFINNKIPITKRNTAVLLAQGNTVYWAECLRNTTGNAKIFLYIWEEKL